MHAEPTEKVAGLARVSSGGYRPLSPPVLLNLNCL